MPSLSYCAEQVRQADHDRFICNLFAPPEHREALFALHAFNVEIARIRESVSQPLLGQMRLQWWSDILDAIYAGRTPHIPVGRALVEVVARFALSRHYFDEILAARALDMEEAAPPDLDALVRYADGTSASLSMLACQVLCPEDADAKTAAREVAIAWALTGLLRAVPYHARDRRIYLPASLNRAAGLDILQVFELRGSSGLSDVVRSVATVARDGLRRARDISRSVSKQALPILLPATMADWHLRRLDRAGHDPFRLPPGRAEPRLLAALAIKATLGRY